ncbi:bifunctional oligoribonuclease/PAP phosphatase NrnA [Candidatus Parcubacteria bacterium]|nr:bifunctional oligoribonuclease/PAP phosphatase NrnA [Candidatus Parcubacteria bacterium]
MEKAIDLIQSSNSIILLSHKNPDGDAVGSVLGLAQGLESIGKKVKCFSKDVIPSVFDFLPSISQIENTIEPEHQDLIVLLDCALFSRTGIENIKDIVSSFDNLLIIDHHPKDKTECDRINNCVAVIDHKVSSTAVLTFNLLKGLNINITKNIANCLLTGIFTDTGGFQHNNTDPQSLQAAAEFMKKGSRIDKIAKNIFNTKSLAAIKLWGIALERIQNNPESGMAISYISKSDMDNLGVKEEELMGLVNVINTISDAKFSLLLTESADNKIKGSLRSEKYKGIDVSRIARSLGGGGHKLASGFEINSTDITKSIDEIRKAILKNKS